MQAKELNKILLPYILDDTKRTKACRAIVSLWRGGTMTRLEGFVKIFNEIRKSNYKPSPTLLKNFDFWLKVYTPEDMIQAVKNCDSGFWMNTDLSPTKLLRTRNVNGECDYISDLLNYKPKTKVNQEKKLNFVN
jgi:hypothetical protein